jgi:MFS family permease
MENEQQQLEALRDIRKMMQESSKFLSLSGLSGVIAGIYALIGAWLAHTTILKYHEHPETFRGEQGLIIQFFVICITVLVLSIVTALIFSSRKAKKNNEKLFDHTSKKLVWNMAVPLFSGGMFCMAMLYHGHGLILLVSPVMLIFYGLALISSSKFTVHDIKYLGYLEILLGLISAFFLGEGLLFWAIGFGVLHIIYGTIMWFKYDRNQ